MDEATRFEWAVKVHCAMGIDHEIPGPHILDCLTQGIAEARYGWWTSRRPEARPELLRREVVTTYGEWEKA